MRIDRVNIRLELYLSTCTDVTSKKIRRRGLIENPVIRRDGEGKTTVAIPGSRCSAREITPLSNKEKYFCSVGVLYRPDFRICRFEAEITVAISVGGVIYLPRNNLRDYPTIARIRIL